MVGYLSGITPPGPDTFADLVCIDLLVFTTCYSKFIGMGTGLVFGERESDVLVVGDSLS